MDAQLEAIGRQFPGWDAWRTGWLFVAEHVTGKTIAARRLGHLLIRVAVADAQIRARLSQKGR